MGVSPGELRITSRKRGRFDESHRACARSAASAVVWLLRSGPFGARVDPHTAS
jgi:hypothetical protein